MLKNKRENTCYVKLRALAFFRVDSKVLATFLKSVIQEIILFKGTTEILPHLPLLDPLVLKVLGTHSTHPLVRCAASHWGTGSRSAPVGLGTWSCPAEAGTCPRVALPYRLSTVSTRIS